MKVYKIGGSSIDKEYKLNSIKKTLLDDKDKKIVVISAIGRYPNAYATDTLLKNTKHITKEEKDLLVSTAEIISSVKMSEYLNSNNIKTLALSPYVFSIYKIKKEEIINLFNKYDVIIIPGFIYTENNIIYTMQRGGSTITSAILASLFKCDLIIITDICGVYTKEPNALDSKHIPILTYDEFLLLNKSQIFFPKEAIYLLKENNITTTFIKYDETNKCSKIIP